MDNIRKSYKLVQELDNIYNRVIDGDIDVLNEIDELIIKILQYDDKTLYSDDDNQLLKKIINAFSTKVDLIFRIISLKTDENIDMAKARKTFNYLEAKRFEIINNFMIGTVTKDDIDSFKDELFSFRKSLYAIPISDNNIIEIAKMKSKIQHFETEVLEDEDVLKVAYENSN